MALEFRKMFHVEQRFGMFHVKHKKAGHLEGEHRRRLDEAVT